MTLHRKIAYFFTLGFSVLFLSTVYAQEPTNLEVVKQELLTYHDSGAYKQDISAVTEEAKSYLIKRIRENKASKNPKKLAMVLDIDETSLSNYNNMVEMNFGGSLPQIDSAIMEAQDPAIVPTLNLYRLAKDQGVAVFFVTGRLDTEESRKQTIANLEKVGYKNWDGLYFKQKGEKTVEYKSGARKKIEDQGYEIVVNMGDQQSDLDGGYADKGFKLPNPFYTIH